MDQTHPRLQRAGTPFSFGLEKHNTTNTFKRLLLPLAHASTPISKGARSLGPSGPMRFIARILKLATVFEPAPSFWEADALPLRHTRSIRNLSVKFQQRKDSEEATALSNGA